MDAIRLVTFDIFGTLVDWRAYIEQAFPGQSEDFAATTAARWRRNDARLPYRALLRDIAEDLNPRAPREMISFFAEGIGFATPFADSRSLQLLSRMAMLGVIANCDSRHLLDVQRSLGLSFDVAVCAEEIGAYKPSADAWNIIFDSISGKASFERRSWLHVATDVHTDLIPAKERGIKTCFLARDGAVADPAIAADYTVTSLWELTELIAQTNGWPVRYQLQVDVKDPASQTALVAWLRREHGPEVLHRRACQSFQVTVSGPTTVVCDYIFTNHAGLREYLAPGEAELARRWRERFPAADLQLASSAGELVSAASQRSRCDFIPPKRA